METFKRICLRKYEIKAQNGALSLEKGKEYLTSKSKNGTVTVFTNFWALVPVNIFSKPKKFT
jgi:hypothetical protein